ncbi:MAG: hypothetical protein ABJC04_07830 [Verrucomicrobiota bacterium]
MKTEKFYLIASAIMLLLASGCGTFRNNGNFGYNEPFNFNSPKVRKYSFDSQKFREAYDIAKTNGVAGEAIAKMERNQILGELMLVIDASHGRMERNLRGGKTGFDLLADFAELGLTGAAAVTGGAETKAILAAIATGVKGADLAINKRVFQDQALEAIQAQMRAAQLLRKAEIIKGMKRSTTSYPLELGLADIVQYFYDGSLTRAFQNLVATAKEKEKTSEGVVTAAKE